MEKILELIKTTHNRELFLKYIELCQSTHSLNTIALNDAYENMLNTIGVPESASLTDSVIQDLKAILLNATTVRISVNEVLSLEFINKLYNQLYSQEQEKGLIEIDLNPFSNGGFVLYKDGKQYNYLFDTLVNKAFADESFRNRIKLLL